MSDHHGSDEHDLPADEARTDTILRSMTEEDLMLETPPDSLWAGIETQLHAETQGADRPETPTAPVIDLTARRARRLGVAAAAIAAALVLLVGVSVILDTDDPDFREFATAELVFDPDTFDPGGAGHSARTTLLVAEEQQRIRFDTADLPEPVEGEDIELWLIGLDASGEIAIIQPVGVVHDVDDPGSFDVPESFSPDDYAAVAVDLSFEPRDGVATHSGRSILRGPLGA